MQHFIVIGSVGTCVILLCREVEGESAGAHLLKRIIAIALALSLFPYYSTYLSPEAKASNNTSTNSYSKSEPYNDTCKDCGKSIVVDNRKVSRLCSDCHSAYMQKQLDQVLDEYYPDYDGKYERVVVCSQCGLKYLESKLVSHPADEIKLCKSCKPVSNFPSDAEIEERAQQFREGLK